MRGVTLAQKNRAFWRGSSICRFFDRPCQGRLALPLARLEAGVLLIDDVNPALAADDAAAFFAQLGGFQRVSDLHRSRSHFSKRPRSGVEARKLGEESGVVNADQRLIHPT